MRHNVTQSPTAGTVVTEKSAQFFAELVLEVLDKPCFREGRAVEYRDSFSDGVVKIRRDDDGRIHFRTPRVPEASLRLSPARSKTLATYVSVAICFFPPHPHPPHPHGFFFGAMASVVFRTTYKTATARIRTAITV